MDEIKGKKKRMLPRHVDGRIMIGNMWARNFFIFFLPCLIPVVIWNFLAMSPLKLLFSFVILGIVWNMFAELNNRETGIDLIKDFIKYALQGDIYYERSTVNERISSRITRFEKNTEKQQ